MMPGMPYTPEQIEQIQVLAATVQRAEIAMLYQEHLLNVKFSAVVCKCSPWPAFDGSFGRNNHPSECAVHRGFMLIDSRFFDGPTTLEEVREQNRHPRPA